MSAYALAQLGDAASGTSLAQNESAFAPSPAALAAGRAALKDLTPYPDPQWRELRAAIASVHGLPEHSILCGAGAMELINCLIRTFAGAGDEVLGSEYGYAYVATVAAQVQAEHVRAREIDMTVCVDAVLAALTSRTRIVFICNPGNPTGTLIANADIVRLRDNLPDDVLLVVDQAYGEFVDGLQDPAEIFALVERGNTVVVRSFSKAYALAAARVGWGCFPPAVAEQMRKLLNPNDISHPSQAMAAAAMLDQAHMRRNVARTIGIRDDFAGRCRALGLGVPPGHANFTLLRFASQRQAQAADKALRAAGLILRAFPATRGGGLPDCLRATICAEPIMKRCLGVLEALPKGESDAAPSPAPQGGMPEKTRRKTARGMPK